jgi:N-acetylmuramoyl-L-alanine amidase CwlA
MVKYIIGKSLYFVPVLWYNNNDSVLPYRNRFMQEKIKKNSKYKKTLRHTFDSVKSQTSQQTENYRLRVENIHLFYYRFFFQSIIFSTYLGGY